jgi:hypothetical protein
VEVIADGVLEDGTIGKYKKGMNFVLNLDNVEGK